MRFLRRERALLLAGLFIAMACPFVCNGEPPVNEAFSHHIIPGDRLRISVAEQVSLTKVYAVAGDGTIDFGFIGRVSIGGLTVAKAEEKIEELLEKDYFKTATVAVGISEFVEGGVLVMGAVRFPKTIPLTSDSILTLVEAISQCGGLTRVAAGTEVRILRWKPGAGLEREILTVDAQSMFDSLDFSNDQYLRPRDMVLVPTLGGKEGQAEFLALGDVASPGFYPWSEGLDVIRAIMRIGVQRSAQWASARILRPDEDGEYSIVPVNLAKLFGDADMSMNIKIMPGDILFIPSAEHAGRGEVFLLGEVARRGAVTLPLDKDVTLAKLILSTGGLTKFANGKKVNVLRSAPDGSKQTLVINVERILNTGAFENDVPLRDGDVIIVPESMLGF